MKNIHIVPTDKTKQETLEQAAETYVKDNFQMYAFPEAIMIVYKDGAKWQAERMYSEEEVYNLLYKLLPDKEELDNWFEQFKKKV